MSDEEEYSVENPWSELFAKLEAIQGNSGGGFLVPKTVMRSLPGFRPWCWRTVAWVFWHINWYGTYYRCMQHGTERVPHPLWALVGE